MDSSIKKLYDKIVSRIYSEVQILDLNEFHKHEEELTHYKGYLPCLLRRLLNPSYYANLHDLEDNKSIYKQIRASKEYTRKQLVEEFLSWCKENNHEYLIRKEGEQELYARLDEISEEFDYLSDVL